MPQATSISQDTPSPTFSPKDPLESSNNNSLIDVSVALDLLPKALRGSSSSGPGIATPSSISTFSSRRPSYAAEFSTRPRLLNPISNDASNPASTPSLPNPSNPPASSLSDLPPSGSKALSESNDSTDISRVNSPTGGMTRQDHGPIGSRVGPLLHRHSMTYIRPAIDFSLTSANINSAFASSNPKNATIALQRQTPWFDQSSSPVTSIPSIVNPSSLSSSSPSSSSSNATGPAGIGTIGSRRPSAFSASIGRFSIDQSSAISTAQHQSSSSPPLPSSTSMESPVPVTGGSICDIWSFSSASSPSVPAPPGSSHVLPNINPNSTQVSLTKPSNINNNNIINQMTPESNTKIRSASAITNVSPYPRHISPESPTTSSPSSIENTDDSFAKDNPDVSKISSSFTPFVSSKPFIETIHPLDISAVPISQSTSTGSPQTPLAIQRNIRSVSFSHDTRRLARDSIPRLASFSEDINDAISTNSSATPNPNTNPTNRSVSVQMQPPAEFIEAFNQLSSNDSSNFNFSSNIQPPANQSLSSTIITGLWDPSSRRHSLATPADSQLHYTQQHQHTNSTKQPLAQHHRVASMSANINTHQQPKGLSKSVPKPASPSSSATAPDSSGQTVATNSFTHQPYVPQVHKIQPHQSHHHSTSMAPVGLGGHSKSAIQTPPQLDPAIDAYFSFDRLNRNSGYNFSEMNFEPPNTQRALSALINTTCSRLYLVQFKGGRVDVFQIPENSNFDAHYGDLVIVDADRGRDLGKVIKEGLTPEAAGWIKWKQFSDQQAALQQTPSEPSSPSDSADKAGNEEESSKISPESITIVSPKPILRYAQYNEIQQLLVKEVDEEKAVKMCSSKVFEKGLNMRVVDAEYQWDRRKLTFFYSAGQRIDFRELVRDLFRIYKTRIWMCATHTSSSRSTESNDDTRSGNQLTDGPRFNTVTSTSNSGPQMAPGTVLSSNYGLIGSNSNSNTPNASNSPMSLRRSSHPNSPTNSNNNSTTRSGGNNMGRSNSYRNNGGSRRQSYFNNNHNSNGAGGASQTEDHGFPLNTSRHTAQPNDISNNASAAGNNRQANVMAAAAANVASGGITFMPSNMYGQFNGGFNNMGGGSQQPFIPQQMMSNNGWRYNQPPPDHRQPPQQQQQQQQAQQQIALPLPPSQSMQNYSYGHIQGPQDVQFVMGNEGMYGPPPPPPHNGNGYPMNNGFDASMPVYHQ